MKEEIAGTTAVCVLIRDKKIYTVIFLYTLFKLLKLELRDMQELKLIPTSLKSSIFIH
jgi:hypothetical protein